MGVLTEIPDNRLLTDKGRLVINPAFDTVLEIQKLYLEDTLTDFEKIDQALWMLVKNRWNLRLFSPAEKVKIMEEIGKRFIDVKNGPRSERTRCRLLILKTMEIISTPLLCRTIIST